MENILLIINIILAAILVILVLFQKSEGGALGIGVSQDSFMFSRTAGNFLTKATAIIATLFIICSLGLTILSRGELTPTTSVIDKIEENVDDAPTVPENIKNLSKISEIAGFIIGGASTNPKKFIDIIKKSIN